MLGGTGAIGTHALRALVAAWVTRCQGWRGHRRKPRSVRAQDADPVMVSMFDQVALSGAFRGHDAVVNLATSMPSMATFIFRRAWRPTERVRIEGSAVASMPSPWRPASRSRVGQHGLPRSGRRVDTPGRRTGSVSQRPRQPRCRSQRDTFPTKAAGSGIVLRFGRSDGPGA